MTSDIVILNYDILPSWIDYLKEINPQLIILDECHYIKNRDSKRSKAAMALCKEVPHVLALSGTPVTNKPIDLWTTLKILDPNTEIWTHFAMKYCKVRFRPWGPTFVGVKNLGELNRRLVQNCMIRRMKKDVLQDLPEKTRNVVSFRFDMQGQREYNRILYEFKDWLREKKKRMISKGGLEERMLRVGYLLRNAALIKMPMVKEWIDDFLESSDEKIVLFAHHKAVIAMLKDWYKSHCVVVDGSVTGKHRQSAVDTFQTSPKVRIFIGQTDAAGVGLNLTAASNLAFVELEYTPSKITQAEDRIHRIGQKDGAMIHYLIASDTIEENVCKVLMHRQANFSDIVDGGKGDDLSMIYNEIVRDLFHKQDNFSL
jgi:SWI/SNF-related matrix-associated actin-dependent regulator 1 of chromatin subfamily A